MEEQLLAVMALCVQSGLSDAERRLTLAERRCFDDKEFLKRAERLRTRFEDALGVWAAQGIRPLTCLDPQYPAELRNLYDYPLLLYAFGPADCLRARRVAIIGSRKIDIAHAQFTERLSARVAQAKVCVVSGLAAGADAAAHRGALGSGRPHATIAVLGQGFGNIYPAENRMLYDRICAGSGLLLSEYAPGAPALPHQFLARNRIIAALSSALLVVQAAARSGSLVTARHALDLGRDVMVVPGSVLDARYEGSHRLLKQGAALVSSAEDVLDLLGIDAREIKLDTSAPSRVLKKLAEQSPQSMAALSRDMKPALTREELLELELEGLIEILPGEMIALAVKEPSA